MAEADGPRRDGGRGDSPAFTFAWTPIAQDWPAIGRTRWRRWSERCSDLRMKSALARMFVNAEPAVTKLQAFQAQAGWPGRAHRCQP